MTTVLDTHRAVKELVEAGASEPLAEAVTRLVKEHGEADRAQLATKHDLAETELRLGHEIKQVELRLEKSMAELKADLLKWLVPLLAGQILVQLGLLAKLAWP